MVIRPLDRDEHLKFVRGAATFAHDAGSAVSFLQCPSWGAVKSGWDAESLGWFRGGDLVGAGLVLYRWLPRVRRCLAYLPEGPVIDWFGERTGLGLEQWLGPLVGELRRRGAFAVKLGPKVVARTWSCATVKRAMASGRCRRLGEVPADGADSRADELSHRLRSLGWRRTERDGDGFADFQPRYLFRLPLLGRDRHEVSAAFSQQWRRNIRLAERAGVRVERAREADLPEFHRLYLQTAERDRFIPRPLEYFQRMFGALNAEEPERIRLYVARRGDTALAAATMVRVGTYAWYSYGASADAGREHRPSNALQWRMIEDCLTDGVSVYDLRGIASTLDPAHHLHGLLRFKVGLGGEAVEYLGEWDFPVNPVLYRAFQLYLARR
ncbi:peptidoglycan bridge formation glycyltransferase FemA/FemB family protein [Actinocrinis puniceicyclus]|uniref:Peptidoglycan bridge formation glycyltransferase FemA/FemB family protein n=1 Tax=Actinocrinis puniceicyclus TaxID=977794 RepID=A0A8J7WNY7_9ACTN|nr:peptidoglycan bridge formation glycyltransferase FemA/FemB family protein [Actinocrinis puniceicyclus]MBS2964788.1 peptidoglycan bridge formation glycyltransferase FemA/FemB family protein [Actinocrinis puniceicyclus]